MPADPVQAFTPAAAGQELSTAAPKGQSAPTKVPAPSNSQPEADYAELSTVQPPAAAQTQKQAPPSQQVLAYHIDDQTKQLYFQVLDQESGQVLFQVPPQEVLNDEARIGAYLQSQSASSKTPTPRGNGD